MSVLRALVLACGAVWTSCSTPADRAPALYLGAGLAGLNNPHQATGDADNTAVAGGARLPLGPLSLRPELHGGDHSVQATPSLTWDFGVAGTGAGAIDGHIGVGATWNSRRENNVLGNTSSAFVRLGFEGYLVGGVMVGAALMAAPWGYDHEDLALAGVAYAGLRF